MKTFVHIVVYTLLLSGFYSCNGDVFVDDIRPSVSELALDGTEILQLFISHLPVGTG